MSRIDLVNPSYGSAEEENPAARAPLSLWARVLIGLAAILVIVVFLTLVRHVIRPFIWAAVVSYILNPVVSSLSRRLHIRRGWSVVLVLLVALSLITWGVSVALPALRADYAALSTSLPMFYAYLSTYVPNAGTVMVLGVPVAMASLVHSAQTTLGDVPHAVIGDGLRVTTGVFNTLIKGLTWAISTFYFLLDGRRLGAWASGRIPPSYRREIVDLSRRVEVVLSSYVRAEVILILIMTVVSFIAMEVLGVKFPFLLAPVIGFLEIFPIIGPFIAIGLVTLVALVGPPGYGLSHVGFAVVVALVFFVLRQLEDYLVIPNVVGHAVKLHPVVILFALLCGATLGGILGMFLAVPVTGALKIIGGYVYDRLVT